MVIYGNGNKMELPTYIRNVKDYNKVIIITAIGAEMGKSFTYVDIMRIADEYAKNILGESGRVIADSNYSNGNGLINYSFTVKAIG